MQSSKCIPNVLGRLGCHAHVLAKPANLLMQIDVALLRLRGYSSDLTRKLTPDLFYLLLAKINPPIRRHDLVKRNDLLLLKHRGFLSLILLHVDLREERHQELITTQNSTPQDIRKEAGQIDSTLGHIFLLVILLAFVGLGSRHNHVWVSLDQVLLQ